MNLKEALDIIDSGEVFSLRIVSFDKARKKGGKIKFYSELKNSTPKGERTNAPKLQTKFKNHYENSTRTCFQCIDKVETASMVTIHIYLILEVNGEKLML